MMISKYSAKLSNIAASQNKTLTDSHINSISFSCGPTKKYDEFYAKSHYLTEDLGRSHLSNVWVKKIQNIHNKIKLALNIPSNYKIALINGSSTGAMDCIFWNMLGTRPCNIMSNGIFGQRWANEILNVLRIPGSTINNIHNVTDEMQKRDFVFTMTETVTGHTWFDENFLSKVSGLRICDATSAVFAEKINWNMLDCTGFSFQKALGGEAGIGCIVFSEKAYSQLLNHIAHGHKPDFQTPRFISLNEKVFNGYMLNTPSLLALNDININLDIFLEKGGLNESISHCKNIKQDIQNMTSEFLMSPKYNNANAILCLQFKNKPTTWDLIQKIANAASHQNIYEIVGHPQGDPCLRLWTGPTLTKYTPYINDLITIIKNAI